MIINHNIAVPSIDPNDLSVGDIIRDQDNQMYLVAKQHNSNKWCWINLNTSTIYDWDWWSVNFENCRIAKGASLDLEF